jgi:hypothetical protein
MHECVSDRWIAEKAPLSAGTTIEDAAVDLAIAEIDTGAPEQNSNAREETARRRSINRAKRRAFMPVESNRKTRR